MVITIDPLTAGVALLTLVGLVLVAWWQLHNMNKTSRATLLEQLSGRWSSLPIREAGHALWQMISVAEKKYEDIQEPAQRDAEVKVECGRQLANMRENDKATYGKMHDLWSFFETVGYLARRGYVRKEDVFEVYAGPVVRSWEVCQNHINDIREKLGTKEEKGAKLLEHFRWLAEEAATYLRRHHSGIV